MRFLKISDIDQLLRKNDQRRLLEVQLIDFFMTLRVNEGLSYGAINGYKCAITKFYVMNDVLLNNKKISSYLGENMRKHTDRGYTTGEIHKRLQSVKHETEDSRAISVERKEVARANGFRKFANTVMIKSKVNALPKEMLLGHTTGL